jgi:hypothetical protein
MPKFIRPDIRVRPTTSISPRPLPRSLIETYYLTESEFRKQIDQLEKDSLFESLVQKGVVRKLRLNGRVPQFRYEESKDEEMVRFFNKYNITRHPDWEHDFLQPSAIGRKHELASKYGAPVGELIGVLRYTAFLSTMRDTLPSARVTSTDSEDKDFLAFTASETVFDTASLAQDISTFVERYHIDQDTFVDLFLSRDPDPDTIVAALKCSREEVLNIKRLVDKMQVLNSFCVEAGPCRQTPGSRKGEKYGPIAEFYQNGEGVEMKINFINDGIYTERYRFHMEDAGKAVDISRQEQEFLGQLRAINQRRNVLYRLVVFLFQYQYKYLLTGNPLHLYPLSQAAAAKAIFEEEATVCRLIRDKTIITPSGVVPIKFFFHRVSKTVENLVLLREREEIESGLRKRPFTDVEIRDILKDVYHVELSRRSITYHRNRCLKKSNFYSRVRKTRETGKPAGAPSGR